SNARDSSMRQIHRTSGLLLLLLPVLAVGQVEPRRLDHGNLVSTLAFTSDGKRLVTGCHDGEVRTWDAATGKVLGRVRTDFTSISKISLSPDDKLVAVASLVSARITIRELATGKEVRGLKREQRGVLSVAFAPDGKTLATVAEGDLVSIWDVKTGDWR